MSSVFGRKAKEKHKNEKTSSLQRFNDTKKDTYGRLKHLKIYLNDPVVDPYEKKNLVEENSSLIYSLFHELFLLSEVPVGRSSKTGFNELELSLDILGYAMQFLPELIAKRWQFNSIGVIMKKLLHPSNTAGVRKFGLRYFMTWYQILGVGPYGTDDLETIFAALIPDWASGSALLEHVCESPGLGLVENTDHMSPPVIVSPLRGSAIYTVSFASMGSQYGSPAPMPSNVSNPEKTIGALLDKILEYATREFSQIYWKYDNELQRERCAVFLMEKVKKYFLPRLLSPALLTVDLYAKPPKVVCPSSLDLDEESAALRESARHSLLKWIWNVLVSDRRSDVSHQHPSDGTLKAALTDSLERQQLNGIVPPGMANEQQRPLNLLAEQYARNCAVIKRFMLSTRPNVNLVFSILHEGLCMPIRYSNTIYKLIRLLRDWIHMEDAQNFMFDPEPGVTDVRVGELCFFLFRVVSFLKFVFFYSDNIIIIYIMYIICTM